MFTICQIILETTQVVKSTGWLKQQRVISFKTQTQKLHGTVQTLVQSIKCTSITTMGKGADQPLDSKNTLNNQLTWVSNQLRAAKPQAQTSPALLSTR